MAYWAYAWEDKRMAVAATEALVKDFMVEV
jgi:hypothetical protein